MYVLFLSVFNTAALRPSQPQTTHYEIKKRIICGCEGLQESVGPPPSGVAVTVSGLAPPSVRQLEPMSRLLLPRPLRHLWRV